MPSAFSHPAVPLTIGLVLGSTHVPKRLLFLGMLASILPDFDSIGMKLGIPYTHDFGHRGASHSLLFAFMLGLLASLAHRHFEAKRLNTFLFVFVSCASHGLLDMLTDAGHGVGLFWPFSSERLWFPCRPIETSPISIRRFFEGSAMRVLSSEFLWVWLPAIGILCLSWGVKRILAVAGRKSSGPC